MMPGDQVAKFLLSGEIEVAPLAFMRGRTLANAFIILDEAQNTTPVQMKMALTRMGENSRMVVTGDLTQVDLPRGQPSGLEDALEIMDDMKGVGRISFTHVDVVRHDLVTRIVQAYDKRDSARAKKRGE
jgi:phosphate starvation-inducible PhoH-like protein